MKQKFGLSEESLRFIKENVIGKLAIKEITEESLDDIASFVCSHYEDGSLDKNGYPIPGKEKELEIGTRVVSEITGGFSRGDAPDLKAINDYLFPHGK